MKIFVTILLATFGLSSADVNAPDGYNYQAQQSIFPLDSQQRPLIMQLISGQTQQQQQQQQRPLLQLPFAQPNQQYLPSIQQQTKAVVMALPMPIGFPTTPNLQGGHTALKSARRLRPRVKIPKKAIVTKNFFIHAAPEDSDAEIQEELSELAQQPRKHYNVLFVKTPAQSSKATAIGLSKALKEEKTVVYVLAKKTTAADLQDSLAEAPQHINKPEVFFIKYHTPEEAANAQRQIQSQYDSLGGTSTITDEGIAPITSVVGSLDAPQEEEEEIDEQLEQQQDQAQQYDEQLVNSINGIGTQYLPPNQY